jgi:uncharacterized membrane protein YkvA (DUF1232 family)
MRIVLDLSDNDVRYFRKSLQKVKDGRLASNEPVVLEAARRLISEVKAAQAPEFVQSQMENFSRLVDMVEDSSWRLTSAERSRILNALAYFVDPDDLIPDSMPGIGYLDDAIMVSLVLQEFRFEIEAYEKFRAFEGSREAVEKKRDSLLTRLRGKRDSEKERRRLVKHGGRGPLGLWG